jgi:hypothetical protein
MMAQEANCSVGNCGSYCQNEQPVYIQPKAPKHPSPKALPKEQTHTLDQILQIRPGILGGDLGDLSDGEADDGDADVATKNLLNAFQSPRQHSPNIFNVSHETHSSVERRKSREKCDEDEKDVVEMSEEKIAEDLALLENIPKAPAEHSELKKEAVEGHADSNRLRPRRPSGKSGPSKKESVLQANRKQLMAASRKLIMDKIKSEKEWRRQQQSHRHTTLTDEELDELYRLPTDHLRHDKDYSNQRIREKLQGSQHANEGLGDPYEGACGGGDCYEYGSVTSDDEIELELSSQTPLILHFNEVPVVPRNALRPCDQHPSPVTLSSQRQEVCSSPEVPPSPRSGARPKKSPKKQRAL